jgi:hypothetical protein
MRGLGASVTELEEFADGHRLAIRIHPTFHPSVFRAAQFSSVRLNESTDESASSDHL